MALSSPNRMVWTHFRSLRRIAARVSKLEDETERQDEIVLTILMSVTAVEAFLNVYFRVLVEQPRFAHFRDMVLEDLSPADGGQPRGLAYKLRHWAPKVLGQSFAWQSGTAHGFEQLRLLRNKLMHFTSSYESIKIPGARIEGLARTDCYDQLTAQDARRAVLLAEGMLEETFRLAGVEEASVPWELHSWTGKPPAPSRA